MSGLLEVTILAGVLLAAITWLAVSLLAPRTGSQVGSSRRRTVVSRAWLYAVVWVPPTVLFASLVGLAGDHCLIHAHDHHHHLCLWHPPHASGDPRIAMALLAVLLTGGSALLRCVWDGRQPRRWARALVATSRASELGANVRTLDCEEPLALTIGVWTPTILLSNGLIDRASKRTLAVVLAHEHAHVARGDLRLARLDRFAAALLPRRVAVPLLEQISLAREQACDGAAVEQIGDRLEVARALTEVARLGLREPPIGLSIGSGALEARVLHLLEPPPASRQAWFWPALCLVALVVAGAGPVHQGVEHVITFLLH